MIGEKGVLLEGEKVAGKLSAHMMCALFFSLKRLPVVNHVCTPRTLALENVRPRQKASLPLAHASVIAPTGHFVVLRVAVLHSHAIF
jgi:hypothetical protein